MPQIDKTDVKPLTRDGNLGTQERLGSTFQKSSTIMNLFLNFLLLTASFTLFNTGELQAQNNSPILNTQKSTYPITPFVVGPSKQAGYQTIQSAINAAQAAGGGTIYVHPGNYQENLTLFDKIEIFGSVAEEDAGNIQITGVHTPPIIGSVAFRNLQLNSPSHVFDSIVRWTHRAGQLFRLNLFASLFFSFLPEKGCCQFSSLSKSHLF